MFFNPRICQSNASFLFPSDDPAQWLKKHTSGTIDRLCMLKVLPWKMGLTLSIKLFGAIHLLLPDISRTDSLLLFLAGELIFGGEL
jgi:hypothetical protein